MNVEGTALKLLLHETDGDKALTYFNQLKSDYFSDTYKTLYANISMFYEKYSRVPTVSDIATFNARNHKLGLAISALELIEDIESADLSVTIDELINQFAQDKALTMIFEFSELIRGMNHEEIKDAIGAMPLELEDCLEFSDTDFALNTTPSFKTAEQSDLEKVTFGLSNRYDKETGGLMRTDFCLLGGKQGSGKSLVSMNVCLNTYLAGFTSVYFSVEVKESEVKQRFYSMLTGIDPQRLKANDLCELEREALALAMVGTSDNAFEMYDEFIRDKEEPDYFAFDTAFMREGVLREDNQFIYIYNTQLTYVDIDMTLAKYKSRLGDALALAVVDYINQVTMTKTDKAADRFDWKEQTGMARLFKNNLAAKYDVALISPYQIDDEGKARLAKGLLDAPDVAIILHGHPKKDRAIGLEVVKSRSANDEFRSTVGMEWDALRVNPIELVLGQETEGSNDD